LAGRKIKELIVEVGCKAVAFVEWRVENSSCTPTFFLVVRILIVIYVIKIIIIIKIILMIIIVLKLLSSTLSEEILYQISVFNLLNYLFCIKNH